MKRSESITELAKALNLFQKDLEQPKKDADNPFFSSKYVPLPNVIEVIQKFATPHGLSYTQMPITEEGRTGVQTIIFHSSGEFIEYDPLLLPMDKQTAQGAGSAITYSRRYSLSAAFGIDSDPDDDGNGASGNNNNNQNKQQGSYNRNNNQSNQNKNYQNKQSGNQSNNNNGSDDGPSESQKNYFKKLIERMEKEQGMDKEAVYDMLRSNNKIGQFNSSTEFTKPQMSAAINMLTGELN